MDSGNRPHSRQKTVGNGSASVGRGRRVDTGSRPVSSGGRANTGFRPASSGGQRGGNYGGSAQRGPQRGLPGLKLNFKSILILLCLIIAAVLLFKKCGGSLFSSGGEGGAYEGETTWSDGGTLNTANGDYASANDASDQIPDTKVSALAREKYYTPVGNGEDTVTVMVYMCGTDLESEYSMATKDLNEMVNASLSEKVNLIVGTGGCKKWQNSIVSNKKNQIYKLGYKTMTAVESDFGTASMTDPANLTRFIEYCKENYPADRNILIFWDHGGGSLSGYGYDEKNPSAPSMTLSKINSALRDADCKFDFIGFDACLMATLETDLVCNGYADYLIASEEVEPGTGWYYTNWLNTLSKNTSTPTVSLAQQIIDDFISASCSSSRNAQVTLSVVDLSELDGTVPDALRDFAASVNELVGSDNYRLVSDARAGVRQFSQKSKLNQIDLIDLALRIGTNEANALAKALDGCIKYNKTTVSRSNGISIYFPYETTKTVSSAIASYNEIGKEEDYSECIEEYKRCIQSFASLEYGGQIAASASQTELGGSDWGSILGSLIGSSDSSASPLSVLGELFGGGASSPAGFGFDASSVVNLLGAFSGRSMPSDYSWVDTELIAENAEEIAQRFIAPSRITATEKGGKRVLSLTDEEWALIQTVELNVFLPDGEGYIDLGLDNTFEWLDDNSLLLEYDNTWLTLNGRLCSYCLVSDTQRSDGSWVTVGRIPALLNGRLVNLQVVFDEENPEGAVTGAYPLYEDAAIGVQAKGDLEVSAGDTVELLCDYYDLDGSYSATYTLSEAFTVPKEGLTLTNLSVEAENAGAAYRLTDIYGNRFWVAVD